MTFFEAATRFAAACDAAGLPYFLGGSAATALYGEPRMTNDLDFVVAVEAGAIAGWVAHMGADFDVDVDALTREARRRGSWNLFYLPDFTKIDVFFARRGPFDQAEFARRRPMRLAPEGPTIFVKSPEDSVLRKLLWYREGGEVSDRQWRDLVMVLRSGAGRLDAAYLDDWAARLDVAGLLTRAREDARPR